MRRELVHEAVRTALETDISKPFGLAEAPPFTDDNEPQTYGIVYPISADGGYGSWDDPEECIEQRYQIRIVGTSPRQAQWLSDRVHDFFVGRKAGGGYSHAIPVAGATVEDRWVRSLGATLPAGEVRFSIDDDYEVRVSNG